MKNSNNKVKISSNVGADFFNSLSSTSKIVLVGAISIFGVVYFFHSGRATDNLEDSATRAIESHLSGTSVLYEEINLNSASAVELKNDITAVNVDLESKYLDSLLYGCDYLRSCVLNRFFSATVNYEAGQDRVTKYYVMKWDPGEYKWTIVEELED